MVPSIWTQEKLKASLTSLGRSFILVSLRFVYKVDISRVDGSPIMRLRSHKLLMVNIQAA